MRRYIKLRIPVDSTFIMKFGHKIVYVSLVMFLMGSVSHLKAQSKSLSADEVIKEAAHKLESLKSISYHSRIEYNYASEAYLVETSVQAYMEFTPLAAALGTRFQFTDLDPKRDLSGTYNGSDLFFLRKTAKEIIVNKGVPSNRLVSLSGLQFSPLMIRNALSKLIADPSIPRSLSESAVGDKKVFVIEVVLDKRTLNSGNGEIEERRDGRTTTYRISFAADTMLPVEIHRGNTVNNDFNRATFSEVVVAPAPPLENSWYYSSFLKEYKYAEPSKVELIKAGTVAPNLSLPKFPDGGLGSLDALKGKVVLLEFWIAYCGFCQAAVPRLNTIHKTFKSENFDLVSVNIANTPEQISFFAKKTGVQFPMLQGGEDTAKAYGVSGYPSIVLIGKDGKIIYSGAGLTDDLNLEDLIRKSLEN